MITAWWLVKKTYSKAGQPLNRPAARAPISGALSGLFGTKLGRAPAIKCLLVKNHEEIKEIGKKDGEKGEPEGLSDRNIVSVSGWKSRDHTEGAMR